MDPGSITVGMRVGNQCNSGSHSWVVPEVESQLIGIMNMCTFALLYNNIYTYHWDIFQVLIYSSLSLKIVDMFRPYASRVLNQNNFNIYQNKPNYATIRGVQWGGAMYAKHTDFKLIIANTIATSELSERSSY